MATGEQEVIPCGLVIRSIGYRGRPLPGVPFDERRGLIRNEGGRVCDEDGARAPRRVRGRLDQARAVGCHRHQQEVRHRHRRAAAGGPGAAGGWTTPHAAADEAWLRTRVPGLVTWRGWEAIDEHERGLGAPAGRPRVKLVRLPQLLAAAVSP